MRHPLILGLLVGTVLAACVAPGARTTTTFATPNTIDGFTLGAMAECSPPVDVDAAALAASCAGDFARATAALDAREPGHAAIVGIQAYTDGTQPGPIDVTGDASVPPLPSMHPGPEVTVVVFTLADGSTRATGVACSGEPTTCIGIGAYPN